MNKLLGHSFVLIDHPDYAREIFAKNHCFETNNTPPDYFSGRTADIIDQRAKEWKEVWSPKLREYAEGLVARKLEEGSGCSYGEIHNGNLGNLEIRK